MPLGVVGTVCSQSPLALPTSSIRPIWAGTLRSRCLLLAVLEASSGGQGLRTTKPRVLPLRLTDLQGEAESVPGPVNEAACVAAIGPHEPDIVVTGQQAGPLPLAAVDVLGPVETP
ncbi:hypothetical protein DMB38_34385 [Streptomyces sp. WAC 06738]|nr:hypothetical protein DMB38_34385 [Streptomyces sp. WAC 06738]